MTRRQMTMNGTKTVRCDVLVIGAGPGGLAAAKGARDAGAERVIVLERDSLSGGILNQCIHDGFGLIRYKEQLTGPEYAHRALGEALDAGAKILCGHQVAAITHETPSVKEITVTVLSREGLKHFIAGAVVMALGCRERTRGAISIPGSRPAGVFTAGVIQNFVNLKNIMPGRRIVILGSGDVGMIMARRLTLEGAEVKAVIEVLPEPAGLARNVSQCLYDYDIPILCSHTISRIIGKRKLTAVEISAIDHDMNPVPGPQQIIGCDALVLSVGLIPENEIGQAAGVCLDSATNGTLTDSRLQTNIPGIFSCGNSRRIMDLADFVSEQGEMAGRNAYAYLTGGEMISWDETRSTSMEKGYPVPGTVTCTLCPNGCQVKAVLDGNTAVVTGNKCPRGADFARQEISAPRRMLTTTVKAQDGKLIPVRTMRPIAKEILFDAMRELEKSAAKRGYPAQTRCGEVLTYVTDADGTKVPVIATREFTKRSPED